MEALAGIVKLGLTAVFDAQHGGVATGWGVVARIVTSPHDAHRQDSYLPMRYDTGRPRAVIRFKISQPRATLYVVKSIRTNGSVS